jgi:hypothetical protein
MTTTSLPRSFWAVLAAPLLSIAASACGADECLRHSDCASELVCTAAGQCEVPPVPDAAEEPDNGGVIPELPDGALGGDLEADAGVPDAEDGI